MDAVARPFLSRLLMMRCQSSVGRIALGAFPSIFLFAVSFLPVSAMAAEPSRSQPHFSRLSRTSRIACLQNFLKQNTPVQECTLASSNVKPLYFPPDRFGANSFKRTEQQPVLRIELPTSVRLSRLAKNGWLEQWLGSPI